MIPSQGTGTEVRLFVPRIAARRLVREAGAAGSVRALFDAHADALRRYARRLVGSRETAEDLVQDVFLRLWLVRDRVELGAGSRSYLYLATRSRALNHIRRERRAPVEPLHPDGCGLRGDEPALSAEGEARVAGDEIARAIECVLAGMPPRQRQVAGLRLRGERTTPEIARELGISPRTVEAHIARATRDLRARLPALLSAVEGGVHERQSGRTTRVTLQ